jgi:hypothetical protein
MTVCDPLFLSNPILHIQSSIFEETSKSLSHVRRRPYDRVRAALDIKEHFQLQSNETD